MKADILAPAAVLVLWTLVMLVWTAATRLPALKAAGIDMSKAVGGRGQDLEGVLPASVNWKAHNYAHLVEQPTLFYAVVAMLAILGQVSAVSVALAWTYVVIRIVHSLVQATSNRIAVRFPLFIAGTLALLGLTVMALIRTLG
ncbi:MAPEG family protein [Sphingomonas sp. MAH-20]|uniref:MAPEG family protein n=1 Tax=Sphingomonas horti TaxID=2682842 RepID=A0A6I4IWG4_9SPHN|nr:MULTISPECIES: MAPEG family protein [Sphingomonas]MBA2920246.1 MAPEG family protein [Sphingomonas sp. CGMCC 1.13658]MVO76500.1 MAPEG family protein [Sphingomonas horti]